MRARIDPDRLLEDITELMDYADELQKRERRRGRGYGAPLRKTPAYFEGALAKGGDDEEDEDVYAAHAATKAAYHAKVGALYQQIADRHAAMSDHYKGAHPSKDDTAETLNKLAGAGDAAARLRLVPRFDDPSRAGFLATLWRSAP